jgi:hypothetical protein
MTPCASDPDRWTDPDPNDLEAKLICRYRCPIRRACAIQGLRVRTEGLWAGVIVPPRTTGGNSYKNKQRRHAQALEQLAHIAGLDCTA